MTTRAAFRFAVALASCLAVAPVARADVFTGTVVDSAGAPIAGAHVDVNQAGTASTAADGSFSIDTARSVLGDHVTAGIVGRITAQLTLTPSDRTSLLRLTLDSLPADSATYVPTDSDRCTECHASYESGARWGNRGGFLRSGHANAATNQTVLDLFNGTASGRTDAASCGAVGGRFETITDPTGARVSRCYVAAGYLADINPACGHEGQPRCDDRSAPAANRPSEFGDCAGCHTPATAIAARSDLDINNAVALGIAGGVTCESCHHIRDTGDPNAPGVLAGATLLRANGIGPIELGPLPDAYNAVMQSSPAPVFRESRFCSPCHQDTYRAAGMTARWSAAGIPSEQTFEEWSESRYASGAGARTCQNCHMPSLEEAGITPSLAIIGSSGPVRPSSQIHLHGFDPLRDAPSRAQSLAVNVVANRDGDDLRVTASVENRGVGHLFPSGVTSRNAVLVVTATIAGEPLQQIAGEVVPDYGGSRFAGIVTGGTSTRLTLDAPPPADVVGMRIRLWRETSEYRDYVGAGLLRTLPVDQKGLHRNDSIGQYTVRAVNGSDVEIDDSGLPPASVAGAHYAIGDHRHLAGAPGFGFAKVSIAATGARNVPFWMATDLLWDNRLAPGETQSTDHRFTIPQGARGTIDIHARLYYRRAFIGIADVRGWQLEDDLAGEASQDVVLAVEPSVDAGPSDAGIPPADVVGADASPRTGSCGCSAPGIVGRHGLAAVALAAVFAFRVRRHRRRGITN